MIQIGAEVKPNDILVGKISPKGETQLSPEERLLRAIFGDKAGDVKDTSLRVPPGVNGIVLDVKHLISRIGDKQDQSRSGSPEVLELKKDQEQGADQGKERSWHWGPPGTATLCSEIFRYFS